MLDGPRHLQNAWLQLYQADREAGMLATTEERYAAAQVHATLALTCAVMELVHTVAAAGDRAHAFPRPDWDAVMEQASEYRAADIGHHDDPGDHPDELRATPGTR